MKKHGKKFLDSAPEQPLKDRVYFKALRGQTFRVKK
jgi:hypothetical protein